MAEGQWYYTQDGRQTGPVSFYQLQQLANAGTLKTTDHVWTEGQEDWKPAGEVAGLFSGNTAVPPPPVTPVYGAGDDQGRVMPSVPPRDPNVMAILSALLPGFGQLILGQTVKGIVLLVLALGLLRMSCLLALVCWIVAIIDAYQIGTKLRRGQSVGQWEFF